MKRTLIVSITSDIGRALAEHFDSIGHEVVGTFRTPAPDLQKFNLIHCDLSCPSSIEKAIPALQMEWDHLILAPGTLEPIGLFESVDFSAWKRGIEVNLLAPLQLVQALLPYRRGDARVLFFAGAGTNGPAPCYSCYTLSKIGLIKMCEQLAAEVLDCTFSIIGPGWVKTKIHEETLQAKERAGANFERTKEQLQGEMVPMERVVECCMWALHEEPAVVNGRNFSLVHDQWGTFPLKKKLLKNCELFKLRRYSGFLNK